MRPCPALLLAFLVTLAPAVRAQTEEVVLAPVADNTLYESATGGLSNGAGAHLFVGRTSQPAGASIRRALLRFDVAAALPAGVVVESAALTLNLSKTIASPQPVTLHRVTASWGEGTSDALGDEGGGVASAAGDATWLHRAFPATRWAHAGGDFDGAPSAVATAGAAGPTTWATTPALVADVQGWLADPAANFGWILVGNEDTAPTAFRFDARENPTAAGRPALRIGFRRTVAADTPGAPAALRLDAPAPHPWGGRATVRFETPGGPARLDLLDLLGRTVATLADGVFAAGPRTVAAAAPVAPGLYVLRLTSGGQTATRPAVVR